ncbi:restriction endonuclease subunit S [Galbibacter sp. EGI 63066]|uniref:restriction endonuclease subunit S n=1 Tax=Galbibacter sp. EGI 63066 TaxID=2993559 RepID=UPI002249860A|nr:restriction endonuclease subunit S [Galbibacter sp. EGI 63066]MCX2679622.1 restriction endonuclease subunit S [Galbibacter sp. EGI 63066]
MSKNLNIETDSSTFHWVERPLFEVCNLSKGEQLNKKLLDESGIYPSYSGGITPSGYTNEWNTDENTIIISEGGNSCGYVNFITQKFWAGGHCYVVDLKDHQVDKQFLFHQLKFNEKKIMRLRVGSGLPNIQKKDLALLKLNFPPLEFQSKLAAILSLWNKAIVDTERLLSECERRKKGLKQQLLSGKVRFSEFAKDKSSVKTPAGELPEDWGLKHISDIVQRVRKPFKPEHEKLYREIGIRSHCKGIFHKEKVTGASLGNKSVFWIQPDCFVVNIVFAWEHAIAKTTKAEAGMIASHRFPMYKPKKGVLDLDYLLYYFKTARGKHLLGLASPGGAGRNKTLGQGEFAKLKIPVPSLEEQKKIVSVLSEADKEIELLQQQIYTLKEQKKGLMQKLLTGEVRVKID